MIRIIFFIIFSIQLFGFDHITASKIFDKIFMGIENKKIQNVYVVNSEYKQVINISNDLKQSPLNRSDIIIFENKDEVKNINTRDKILFATSYSGFKSIPESIGAFYWFKGRPQIIFIKDRLIKNNIKLKHYLQKYITDEL